MCTVSSRHTSCIFNFHCYKIITFKFNMKIYLIVCLVFLYISLCESYSRYSHEALIQQQPRHYRNGNRYTRPLPQMYQGVENDWRHAYHRNHHHRHYIPRLTTYPSNRHYHLRGCTRHSYPQTSAKNFNIHQEELESDIKNRRLYLNPIRHGFHSVHRIRTISDLDESQLIQLKNESTTQQFDIEKKLDYPVTTQKPKRKMYYETTTENFHVTSTSENNFVNMATTSEEPDSFEFQGISVQLQK